MNRLFTSRRLAALAMVSIFALPQPARAADSPNLQSGLWELQRTVSSPAGGKPQVLTTKKCQDPIPNMKAQNAMMEKGGCKVTPVVHSGSHWSFQAACTIQGKPIVSKSVLTVLSPTAYRLDVEVESGGQKSKETLIAKRVGDCPK